MKPASQDELWQAMRSADPPRGAREKILTRLERELEPSRHRRAVLVPRLALLGVLAGGSALAAVGFHSWQVSRSVEPSSAPSARSPANVTRAQPARPESVASPASAASPTELPEAPPPSEHESPPVTIPEATAPVAPKRGPGGRSVAAVAPPKRGSENAADPVPAPEAQPAKEPAKTGTDPSSLSEQVAAYRRIAAMTDRSAAVQEWRAMLERWPSTTLRHEIELNLVNALIQLGRREEARQAAATFLRHFPKSPRAADVKPLLGAETPKP